ncbi:MAG TPA: phytanoyl-CoA dioxygenase family protein [Thermomicrobiales bacterium]|nr:phytanoyl-CoA dioxygenase family protein [Thermomicrobiales bacterium]
MTAGTVPKLVSSGQELDPSPSAFGPLRSSIDAIGDIAELRQRMESDGYLYLPGYLDREEALAARRTIVERLEREGALEPGTDPMQAVIREGIEFKFRPDLARDNPTLDSLLYAGRMIEFYERFLGGEVRHLDYTWLRAVAPGRGTAPHGDSVFMNRGTQQLYTAWVPLGDVDYTLGGLIVLEKSHKVEEIKNDYGSMDVDSFCANFPDAELYQKGDKWWNGSISDDPFELRRQLGVRWLSSEFRAGDLLTFTIFTLHASLDNRSNRIRISSDSRYQLASEPIDERWVGENPIGHGSAGKRGRIC